MLKQVIPNAANLVVVEVNVLDLWSVLEQVTIERHQVIHPNSEELQIRKWFQVISNDRLHFRVVATDRF